MNENWKPIPGYEGLYEVSDQGRVRSLGRKSSGGTKLRGKNIRPGGKNSRKYPTVVLYKEGQKRSAAVHRLVLLAFVGPPPEGTEACHSNDDRYDNRLENLRWDSRAANVHDQIKNGVHPSASKTECRNGHPYKDPNILWTKEGKRVCKTCHRKAVRKWTDKNAERVRKQARDYYAANRTRILAQRAARTTENKKVPGGIEIDLPKK